MSFNPDAFLCYKSPDGSISFFFHEHDNNTETNLFRLYRKYAAYLAYRKEKRFVDFLRRYLNKHGISVPDEMLARADFKTLTTTPTHDRRDKLLREVNKLEDSQHFYFAATPDLTPDTIHKPIWYRASDYDVVMQAEQALPKETKPSVRARYIRERMPTLPTYALSD